MTESPRRRLRVALRPRRLARSLAAAALTLLAGPALALLVLLGFGAAVGTNAVGSMAGSVAWVLAANLITLVLTAVMLLQGVVAVARVQLGESTMRAFVRAAAALPLLLLTVPLAIVGFALAVVLSPVLVLAGLAVAAIRRQRRLLLAAVPLLPAALVGALVPALLAAALARPATPRWIVRDAVALVRSRKRRLAAFSFPAMLLTGLLTVAAAAVTPLGQDAALIAAAAATFALVLLVGAALGLLLPPTGDAAPATPRDAPTADGARAVVAGAVAIAVIAASMTLGPVAPVAAAEIDPGTEPIAASQSTTGPEQSSEPVALEQPSDLIQPELTLGFDGGGSQIMLSAQVTVEGAPADGTVQFLDGGQPLGDPIELEHYYEGGPSGASLSPEAALEPGLHRFSFRYVPTSPLVAAASADEREWRVVAGTIMTITLDPDAAAGEPAEVLVELEADYPTAVKPDGEVVLRWTGGDLTAPLVDGTARATVPAVPTAGEWPEYLDVEYAGSDFFEATSGFAEFGATPRVDATVTEAYVINPPHVLGAPIYGGVNVSARDAPFGTVVRGSVRIWSGSTLLLETGQLRSQGASFELPTADLGAGEIELRFEFVPTGRLAPSEDFETIELAQATTSLTATPSTVLVARGDAHTVAVELASSLDGARTVEVRDGERLLARGTVTIVDGEGAGDIDLAGRLGAGGYSELAVVAVGDADRAEARATLPRTSVQPARTATAITLSPATTSVGETVRAVATVTSPAGLDERIGGQLVFAFPDGSQQQATVVDGVAAVDWVPSRARSGAASATYRDPSSPSAFAGSSAAATATLSLRSVPEPTVSWTGTLRPDDRSVTLDYRGANGPLPTGAVTIIDADGERIVAGFMNDGVITLVVQGTTGAAPVLRAVYAGDDAYGPRTSVLPTGDLVDYAPVVAVDVPASARPGQPVQAAVTVSGLPLTLVESVVVSSTFDGVATEHGAVTLDLLGRGSIELTPSASGSHAVTATVVFAERSGLAPVVARDAVEVDTVPVPVLEVLPADPATPIVEGRPVELIVRASNSVPGTAIGIPDGRELTVVAAGRSYQVVLRASQRGLTGSFTVPSAPRGGIAVSLSTTYGVFDEVVTASSTLQVERGVRTELHVYTVNVQAGDLAVVPVRAYLYGNQSGSTRSILATATVDGVAQPVYLDKEENGSGYAGSVRVQTRGAGDMTVELSVEDDGADVAAATTSGTLQVRRLGTQTFGQVTHTTTRAGDDLRVSARMFAFATVWTPDPTGTITVTAQPSGAQCTMPASTQDRAQECIVPGAGLTAGLNTLTYRYSGDTSYDPSSASERITLAPRASRLDVRFSPAPEEWVLQDPITATWTTTVSGREAAGRVVFRLGDQSCSAAASAGSCTLTPMSAQAGTDRYLGASVAFEPSDDAPAIVQQHGTFVDRCLSLAFSHPADVSKSVRCGARGTGFREGTKVTLTAPALAPNYVLHGWEFRGASRDQDRFAEPGRATVRVESSGSWNASVDYAPACFTLQVGPHPVNGAQSGGILRPITRPNCSDPNRATPLEEQQLRDNEPRYAAGTVVQLLATPSRSAYAVTAISDSDVTGTGEFYSVVMDRDRTVNATFGFASCTAFELVQAEGGRIRLVSAQRPPGAPEMFRPYDGDCTTADGRPGFAPGTTLTLSATADAGDRVHGWHYGTDRIGVRPGDVSNAFVPVGRLPAGGPTTKTVVVPSTGTGTFRASAQFTGVRCVTVTLVSRAMGPQQRQAGIGGESGCNGVATTVEKRSIAREAYTITTAVLSLVATGTATPYVSDPSYRTRTSTSATQLVTAEVNWSSSATGPVAAGAIRDYGPQFDLTAVGSSLRVEANWSLDAQGQRDCTAPVVRNAQNGGVIVRTDPDTPYCSDRSKVGSDEVFTVTGVPQRSLTPVISVAKDAWVGQASVRNRDGGATVEFCTPLTAFISFRSSADDSRILYEEPFNRWFTDDGGCPPGWSLPDRTTTLSLAEDLRGGFETLERDRVTADVITIDANGDGARRNVLTVRVRCYAVQAHNATVTTRGNCAGDPNRYKVGTAVMLDAFTADKYNGWTGADRTDGRYAGVVVIDADRVVTAHTSDNSYWEDLGNMMSSVAQRALGAVLTLLSGELLGGFYLGEVLGRALDGVSQLLDAVGLDGAVSNAIARAGRIVTAQFDAANLLASCFSQAGGSGSLNLVPSVGESTSVPAGGSIDDLIAEGQGQLTDRLDDKGLPAGDLAEGIGNVLLLGDAFGTNLASYFTDARDSWSGYPGRIGSCLEEGVGDYVENTFH